MNLLTALTTVQQASGGNVSVTIEASLVKNCEKPLWTDVRLRCNVRDEGGSPVWISFEAPNLEAAVGKALEALNAKA